MIRITGFLALSLIMAAGSAGAQGDDAATNHLRTFCSGDYLSLCNGMDPKGPEVVACFRRNMGKLSPGCRTAIDEYKASKGTGSRS
ncbi:3',5'-cyclic-nucleotide phosphodiesterase [Methylobacterium sp. J-067]|uniref:3',5'-cyclic-nucleotide phosphodiesterase n=1 Tax=Methylobacterium sp. J-067 TaxID=2836648 RepID=UPI001FBA111D|nr:3',5'-cyclic-nucleotide phosphodiesterase [Methylobacterium sp. J-067]MCJ2023647.1 3',5'-cyclic-nucleotide phosphodiesterase [Methylobacterium sp. J-067]